MLVDSIVKMLLPLGGMYFIVAHNLTWRKKLVTKRLLSAPEEVGSFLPEINRSHFFETLNGVATDKVVLIEGPQGSGKTYCLQKYLSYQYHAHQRPVIYLSLRKIGEKHEALEFHHLADSINYIGAGLGFHDYSETMAVLNDCLRKIADKKPIVVFDDSHVCFRDTQLWRTFKLNLVVVNAMSWVDEQIAQPIFISSDYMVYSRMRGLSGMRSRLEYVHLDELSQEEFVNYIVENKNFFSKKVPGDETTLKNEFIKFHKYFSTNLRDLESFMYFQGTMDEYIQEGIDGGIQDLIRAMNIEEFQKEFKELLKKIAKFENVTLGNFEKTQILNSLISDHILAISRDKKIHFQKPLLKYAFEKFYTTM